jgi:hypothetical protein
MYIYESELEQWRVVPLSEKIYFPEKGVYWNEAIHGSKSKNLF